MSLEHVKLGCQVNRWVCECGGQSCVARDTNAGIINFQTVLKTMELDGVM